MVNNLGGNMPQERLDRIKGAWMARYCKTEEEWTNFQSENKAKAPTINYVASGMGYTSQAEVPSMEFDLVEDLQSKLEFLLCPDWLTMEQRFKNKEQYCRSKAARSRYTDAASARKYVEEAETWKRISAMCSTRNEEIRRNR